MIDRTSPEYAHGGLVTGTPPFSLGRIVILDARDVSYPLKGAVKEEAWDLPTLPRWMNRALWRGDQGDTQECTGFSAEVVMAGEPFSHLHYSPQELYALAKRHDVWQGVSYEGSSVRGAAKGLMAKGEIKGYRWAYTVDDVRKGIRWTGMAVLGLDWHAGMYSTDRENRCVLAGPVDGGHAIAVVGYDDAKFGGAVLLQNSWLKWGREGLGWLTYEDLATLLKRDGEACSYLKYESDEDRGHEGLALPPGW